MSKRSRHISTHLASRSSMMELPFTSADCAVCVMKTWMKRNIRFRIVGATIHNLQEVRRSEFEAGACDLHVLMMRRLI